MPLPNLLKSAAGTCRYCGQKAGVLSRSHSQCRRTFKAGWNKMVHLAAEAAKSHEFHGNSLRVSLTVIARRSYGDTDTVGQALEEGWRRAARHAQADESITHDEEIRLRRFRERLGLNSNGSHVQATADLNRIPRKRLLSLTEDAAATVEAGDRLLKRFTKALRKTGSDR